MIIIIINSEVAMSRKVEAVVREEFGLTKQNRDKPYSVIAFKTQI